MRLRCPAGPPRGGGHCLSAVAFSVYAMMAGPAVGALVWHDLTLPRLAALAAMGAMCLARAIAILGRWRTERLVGLAAAERERAEQLVVTATQAERRRIARETHDIVGHALNVMLLQAGAARRAMATDPSLAGDCLEAVENVGRIAFRDLELVLSAVDVVSDRTPGAGLADVPQLVEVMRGVGLRIALRISGDDRGTSTLVDWSAYRLVQEALTNVAKHAPGAVVEVSIALRAESVLVEVIDWGPARGWHDQAGAVRQPRHGRGLIGMQERVVTVGGTVTVGAHGNGFRVWAELPRQGRSGRLTPAGLDSPAESSRQAETFAAPDHNNWRCRARSTASRRRSTPSLR
jgi:signal transduction histidine kinase